MPVAPLLMPAWLRGIGRESESTKPGWYNRRITSALQSISRRATSHPIHTVTFIAILASSAYIALIESPLFQPPIPVQGPVGPADFSTLSAASRQLKVGEETAWKWQAVENGSVDQARRANSQELALLTFVFPDSSSSDSPPSAPPAWQVPIPPNCSAQVLPISTNLLSPVSHDTTLAFSLPYPEAPNFLDAAREIPAPRETLADEEEVDDSPSEKRWVMKAAKAGAGGREGVQGWASNAWTSFLDLLKNAETLDIFIMALGYLAMHLTFLSLFLSMRRMGSNFWLWTTVMLNSFFSLFFALTVTISLGVPINVVLLSEGLPFLVIIIGFEKPILLTKAVLSASLSSRKPPMASSGDEKQDTSITVQGAVQTAVREKGAELVRDYAIEIAILIAGAASTVQGGLRQFCFLAAWILFFDCILLFTFYTAILTIKLEINRIKRHVIVRRALEEDGVSRKVAEEVASSNDWPQLNNTETDDVAKVPPGESTIFGRKIRDASIPKFKICMVLGFLLLNVVNFYTIPFRSGSKETSTGMSGFSGVGNSHSLDPFKVAGNGLDEIAKIASRRRQPTIVTVFAPIKFELLKPPFRFTHEDAGPSIFHKKFADETLEGMGGRVVQSILKSFEDPVLSKWIITALAMSLILNGYLFNAARWTIKEPSQQHHKEDADTTENSGVANGTHAIISARQVPKQVRGPSSFSPICRLDADAVDIQKECSVPRSTAECEALIKEKNAALLTDEELTYMCLRGKIPGYALERTLGDMTRAVKIRRAVVSRTPGTSDYTSLLEKSLLPFERYDYERVFGACCENVIGYMPLPVGVAGPVLIDGTSYFLPMATTEGVLVASASRGCKAINAGGGATTVLIGDGMTRGPCISFTTLARAGAAKIWLDSEEGQRTMRNAFDSTSRFARLSEMKASLAGTYLFVRFRTTTGDAMGMNMISKGVEHSLKIMATEAGFDDMTIISVSGNYCTDKKPAAINWIDGRGKSVVAEATIPADIVKSVLKSDVNSLVELNIGKNLVGSAMAGSIGGFNAHAGNIVTAIFLATGQDPAQNVESSNCITLMKNVNGNLQISVSLPSIEVGTIGGGTILEPQAAMLDMLGVRGPHATCPGANAQQLARIIAAGVLAGELSLCAALSAGHLVRAHMAHNRSNAPSRAPTPAPSPSANATGPLAAAAAEAREKGASTPTSDVVRNIRDRAMERSKR